jgi:hypothetical protein
MTPIDELALIGKLSDNAQVFGKKFTWHTLDSDEHISASAASALWDHSTRDHVMKVEKLARAIDTIDGVPFSQLLTKEEKDRNVSPLTKARECISRWQRAVTDTVYSKYQEMENRQMEQVRELEKNGKSPLASSTDGGRCGDSASR